MFGSNFPVDSLVTSFNRIVRGTMAALHPFGEGAVRQVMGLNALRIYRIEAPEQVRSASAGEQFA